MEIPIPTIECLRCTASCELDPGAIQKDTSGTYQPINVRRPQDWIAGPAPAGDPTKGLCPRCAPDWAALQSTFLATLPSDPEVVPRKAPFSIAPQKTHQALQARVGTMHSTNIPVRDQEPPRPSLVPVMAAPVDAPQMNQAAAPPPPSKHLPTYMRGVTMAPNRHALATPAPAQMTRMAPVANAVRTSTLAQHSQAVRVAVQSGVPGSVPATSMQRISQAALPNATPPSPLAHGAMPMVNVTKTEKLPIGYDPFRPTSISPLLPGGGHLQGGGFMTTGAPVPIQQPEPIAFEDGSTMQGCVTTSAPVPIEPKVLTQ